MGHETPDALLERFVSGLEHFGDEILVYGPGAELAGRRPGSFNVAMPSMFLDFTMAQFMAAVDQSAELLVRADYQRRSPELAPEEAAVQQFVSSLEETWVGRQLRLTPEESHFRLIFRPDGRPVFTPLRSGGPTTWVPPLSDAFAAEVGGLVVCEPWSLDQLERFLWVLAGRRQFERFGLLGAWPLDPRRFVCVLSHPAFGAVGVVVEQRSEAVGGPVDVSVRRAAEDVVLLNLPDVARWREQGWEKDGIVWNADPTSIVTPWSGDRPPGPGDSRVRPGEHPWRRILPPSLRRDPWLAAPEDLDSWVEQSMWASTQLGLQLRPGQFRAQRYRWAAGWVIAPDCFAHVDALIWSPDGPRQGAVLRGMPFIPDECALPGQRYLRQGSVSVAFTGVATSHLGLSAYTPSVEDRPPHNALQGRVGHHEIAWGTDPDTRHYPPESHSHLNHATQVPLAAAQRNRIAQLLHAALDHVPR